MSDRTEVEQELMDASKFKSKNYPDRQDELAALVRACERMPDAAFDTLSDGAAEWYNKAATAMNEHEDIPDFEEPESDDEETSDDTDHEADEAAEDDSEGDSEGDEDEDADDSSDVNEGSIEEDEADESEPPKKKKSAKVSEESQREDDEEPAQKPKGKQPSKSKKPMVSDDSEGTDESDTEGTPKKGRGRPKKAAGKVVEPTPEPKDTDDGDGDTPAPKQPKAPRGKGGHTITPYDNLTGEKDRFGLFIGTKTQQAVALYEKGATCKQVEMELAGRHRNILKRLALDGHRVEKLEGGVYKVTHKDDFGAKAKGKKK
jgi:hypothetical protein